jgi:hypothetical protein
VNVHVKVAPGATGGFGHVFKTAIPVVIWAGAADANSKPESIEGNHLFIGALVSFGESKPSTPD